jgi:predicted nucleotidyltransferase component of viral defense system
MTRDELSEVASIRGLSVRNVELDYLQDVCLHTVSRFRRAMVFKGGTALFKFHGLNRFSEDLDFVLGKRRLDLEKVRDRVARSCNLLGIGSVMGRFDRYRNEANMDIHLRGPLYDGSKESMARVAFNLSLREVPQEVEPILHPTPFRELPAFELHVMSLREMMAEKVRAIMTRDKPRDIYDLWFLFRKGIPLDIGLAERKLSLYDVEFSVQDIIQAAERMRGAWKRDLGSLIIGRLPDFDGVLVVLREDLEGIPH